jgi:hypothetical protein
VNRENRHPIDLDLKLFNLAVDLGHGIGDDI